MSKREEKVDPLDKAIRRAMQEAKFKREEEAKRRSRHHHGKAKS